MDEKTRALTSKLWALLIETANNNDSITIDEVAKNMNITVDEAEKIRIVIRDYCNNNQLPLITLLITDPSEKINSEFLKANRNRIGQEFFALNDFVWSEVENPFE